MPFDLSTGEACKGLSTALEELPFLLLGKRRDIARVVEAVIDKDLASELLSRELDADLFVMATDVDGVYLNWGKPDQRRVDWATPEELRALNFAAGSMGPKVDAACKFVEAMGKRAAIGSLEDIEKIVAGQAGTNVAPSRT